MAGTQTTVLVEGDPKRDEVVAGSKVNTSDVVSYVSGSVGSVEPVPTGGTAENFKVAREALDVDYGGSYAASELAQLFVLRSGDKAMVKAHQPSGATGSITAGELLGVSANEAGALGTVANDYDAFAIAHGTVGTSVTKKLEIEAR